MDRRKALKNAGLILGATMITPSALSLLQSCNQEPRLGWQPEFFDENEARTVSAIIDMILPRTETPGGLDVKADMFIDKVVAQVYDEEGKMAMREGLAQFNKACEESHGAPFVDLSESDRAEVLKTVEKQGAKFNSSVWGTTVGHQEPVGFYRSLKSTALWAYFTSEEMGEKVLSYDPIPQNYHGCVPVSEIGNRWSL